jgi:hypothetical protein
MISRKILYEFRSGQPVITKYLPIIEDESLEVDTEAFIKIGGDFYYNKSGEIFYCANDRIWKRNIGNVKYDPIANKHFEFNAILNYCVVDIEDNNAALSFCYDRESLTKRCAQDNLVRHPVYRNLYVPSDKFNIGIYRVFNNNIVKSVQTYKFDPSIKTHKMIIDNFNKLDESRFLNNDIFSYIAQGMLKYALEIETTNFTGAIADLKDHFLIPLKDGSLPDTGMEFCTPPLSGVKGLYVIKDIMKYIASTSTIDSSCALHVHVDISDLSKDEIVALYILYLRVQDEINGMFPAYIESQVSMASKSKEYSARLPSLNIPLILRKSQSNAEIVEQIYEYIKSAYTWEDSDRRTEAPWGSSWNCASRYMALNMVPYFLGKNTVEFRSHPPTRSYSEVLNWIALISAMLQYVRAESNYIINSYHHGRKINLLNIIESIPVTTLSIALSQYVESLSSLRASQWSDAISTANLQAAGVSGRNRYLMNLYNAEYNDPPQIETTYD